jgi:hypothetical protein
MTLTVAALVASFALSADGGAAKISSANQTSSSNRSVPVHRLLFPNSTYMIDDGTAENTLGFGDGGQNFEALWFNQFDVIPGQTTIASVNIAWGSSSFSDPDINGTPITIALWSDPNGDGNPSDAVLLGATTGFMVNSGTDTLVTYPFTPAITLPAGATSFFVGDMTPMNNGPEHFWQALDETSTLRQSWVAGMTDGSPADLEHPGNNDFLGIVDDFGYPGNWLIRADAGDGSNNLTLTATLRRHDLKRYVVLGWTPAGGGSVNVIRNGKVIATSENDGHGQDTIERFDGVLIYQVCKTDGSGCSNQIRLKLGPRAD